MRGQAAGPQAKLGEAGDQEAKRTKQEGRQQNGGLYEAADANPIHASSHHRTNEEIEGKKMHPGSQKDPIIGKQHSNICKTVKAASRAGKAAEDKGCVYG
jgi:hypothetical protein